MATDSNNTTVSTSALTNAKILNLDSVPVCIVVEVTPGMTWSASKLSSYPGVYNRTRGRAAAQILGPIKIEVIQTTSEDNIVCAVAILPADIPSDAPTTMEELLHYNACIVSDKKYAPRQSGTLSLDDFVPGTSSVILGATTSQLAGNPPVLYIECLGSQGAKGLLRLSFDVSLSGYDWLSIHKKI